MYKKVCRNPRCLKEFTTYSRNAQYCCLDCQKSHYASKKLKRKKYDATADTQRLLASSYKIAQKVMSLKEPVKACFVCGKLSTVEAHHINCNPLDNRPENLTWLCKSHHAMVHTRLKKVNMVDVIEALKSGATIDEDRRPYDYFDKEPNLAIAEVDNLFVTKLLDELNEEDKLKDSLEDKEMQDIELSEEGESSAI